MPIGYDITISNEKALSVTESSATLTCHVVGDLWPAFDVWEDWESYRIHSYGDDGCNYYGFYRDVYKWVDDAWVLWLNTGPFYSKPEVWFEWYLKIPNPEYPEWSSEPYIIDEENYHHIIQETEDPIGDYSQDIEQTSIKSYFWRIMCKCQGDSRRFYSSEHTFFGDILTLAADQIGNAGMSARLNGTQIGMDTVHFDWGRSSTAPEFKTSPKTATTDFDQFVTGLSPATLYYFRAVGVSGETTYYGDILNFFMGGQVTPPPKVGYMWVEGDKVKVTTND